MVDERSGSKWERKREYIVVGSLAIALEPAYT